MGLAKDFSGSAALAGAVAVTVGYSGPTVLVLQAAASGGLSDAQLASWLWAISIGSGLASIVASLRFRMPVVAAWSTPGVALLAAALGQMSYAEAIGAYVVASLAVLAIGVAGLFERAMRLVPAALAAALLAGILFPFVVGAVAAMQGAPALVGAMVAAYFGVRRFSPRWAIAAVLAAGAAVAGATGRLHFQNVTLVPAMPVWTTPEFSLAAVVGLALPLALVALTGQYLSGFAVLRASGYDPPADRLVRLDGGLSLLLAPFGCHGVNPSAIVAAICTGPEAHPDPERRYVAGVTGGVLYLAVGCFGATLAALFAALPKEMIAALAGLALLGATVGSASAALAEAEDREAAFVTFAVTAGGVTFLGLGAAFWGLVAGLAVRRIARALRG